MMKHKFNGYGSMKSSLETPFTRDIPLVTKNESSPLKLVVSHLLSNRMSYIRLMRQVGIIRNRRRSLQAKAISVQLYIFSR